MKGRGGKIVLQAGIREKGRVEGGTSCPPFARNGPKRAPSREALVAAPGAPLVAIQNCPEPHGAPLVRDYINEASRKGVFVFVGQSGQWKEVKSIPCGASGAIV